MLRLEANNGENISEDRVTVIASAGNLRPVADAGEHEYLAYGGPFELNGTTSFDRDNAPSPLAFAWTLVARPPSSALTSSAIRDAHLQSPTSHRMPRARTFSA